MQKASRAIALLLAAVVIAGIVFLMQPDSSENQVDLVETRGGESLVSE